MHALHKDASSVDKMHDVVEVGCTALRSAASDEEIADRWVVAMRGKRAGHGIDDPSFLQPDRPMSAIGG